ncbi:MAG TPA: hypothetical protein VLX28_10510, partial [Thermoanaerobaculia bacterium]|nr:hypothetical protein [Thermoanaerobaculia bacterium]
MGASLKEKLDSAFGGWAAFAAVGTFVLHAMGFLSLRFHLAALGVRADLSLLDSRYLFEGANFLVYLLATFSSLLLILLGAGLALFLLSRLIPQPVRERLRAVLRAPWERLPPRYRSPGRLALVGIVFAVVTIQLVMRQCLCVQDLLFLGAPSDPAWVGYLLLARGKAFRAFFFAGLLVLVGVTAWLRLAAGHSPGHGPSTRLGLVLLTLLLGVEVVFLPINYGILTAGNSLPRVIHLGDDRAFAGRPAWLVWEDQEGLTLLLISPP